MALISFRPQKISASLVLNDGSLFRAVTVVTVITCILLSSSSSALKTGGKTYGRPRHRSQKIRWSPGSDISAKNCSNSTYCCPQPYFPTGLGECENSVGQRCKLPQLPSEKCCMEYGLPSRVVDRDLPQYSLIYPDYMPETNELNTIHPQFPQCHREHVIRQIFDKVIFKPHEQSINYYAYAIPIGWDQFLSVAKTLVPKLLITELISGNLAWPEILMPFLLPFGVIIFALASILPLLILGWLGWSIVFNLRFLGCKKIRMAIRAFLISREKKRRRKYELAYPREHLRKFLERDRYQMPKQFQDSDLSEDDEPVELRREPIPPETPTVYTDKEISLLGYDPEHIPMEWVYGDLMGQPEELAPEVRDYISRNRDFSRDREEQDDDFDRASLHSEEWADVLQNRMTEQMTKDKTVFLHTLKERFEGKRGKRNSADLLKFNRSMSTARLNGPKGKGKFVRKR